LRPYDAQVKAFYEAWPAIIRKMQPELTEEGVLALVPKYCAKPADHPTPTPHLTGGAVDVVLVNTETNEPFERGYFGQANGSAYPDYWEGELSEEALAYAGDKLDEIITARRVLFYAMTVVGGFTVNPFEIWHYGVGDPLSAWVSDYRPYYGVAES
jgi:D-alanyl-D-alanine dipeptidase